MSYRQYSDVKSRELTPEEKRHRSVKHGHFVVEGKITKGLGATAWVPINYHTSELEADREAVRILRKIQRERVNN